MPVCSRPFLYLLLLAVVLTGQGCTIFGAVVGDVLAEPEMNSDQKPFPPGTHVTFTYRDGSKANYRFLGVDELDLSAYRTYYRQYLGVDATDGSAHAGWPFPGDSVQVSSQANPDFFPDYVFEGFTGFRRMRMALSDSAGVRQDLWLSDMNLLRTSTGASTSSLVFLDAASRRQLPSSSVFVVGSRDGQESVLADNVYQIKKRVRLKRIAVGALIGLAFDVALNLWLHHECGSCGGSLFE